MDKKGKKGYVAGVDWSRDELQRMLDVVNLRLRYIAEKKERLDAKEQGFVKQRDALEITLGIKKDPKPKGKKK